MDPQIPQAFWGEFRLNTFLLCSLLLATEQTSSCVGLFECRSVTISGISHSELTLRWCRASSGCFAANWIWMFENAFKIHHRGHRVESPSRDCQYHVQSRVSTESCCESCPSRLICDCSVTLFQPVFWGQRCCITLLGSKCKRGGFTIFETTSPNRIIANEQVQCLSCSPLLDSSPSTVCLSRFGLRRLFLCGFWACFSRVPLHVTLMLSSPSLSSVECEFCSSPHCSKVSLSILFLPVEV